MHLFQAKTNLEHIYAKCNIGQQGTYEIFFKFYSEGPGEHNKSFQGNKERYPLEGHALWACQIFVSMVLVSV